MQSKGIKFTVSMDTSGVRSGATAFNTELSKMMDQVKTIQSAMNQTGIAKLKDSVQGIREYISVLNKVGQDKTASNGFIRIAVAMRKIGSAVDLTVDKFEDYKANMQGMIKLAQDIGKNEGAFNKMSTQAAKMAAPFAALSKAISTTQLETIIDFINQTDETAGATINLSPLADQIQRIADNATKIALVRRSLRGIVDSLSNAKVGEVAKSLSMMGRGGGGGGGFGSIDRMQFGEGALGKRYLDKTHLGIAETVQHLSVGTDKEIATNFKKFGDSIIGGWNTSSLRMGRRIKKMLESGVPDQVEAAQKLSAAKGAIPIMTGSQSFRNESRTEITGRGNVDFNILRGNALHAVSEEMISKAKSVNGDIGSFIQHGMFNDKKWIQYIDDSAKHIPEELERMVRGAYKQETGMRLEGEQARLLTQQMTNLGNQIRVMGKGPESIFKHMGDLVAEKYAVGTKEFTNAMNQLQVITEHNFPLRQVMKPGGKFTKGVPQRLQKQIKNDIIRIREGLKASGDVNNLNKFNEHIQKFGLWLGGEADVIMKIGKDFLKVIDTKSGVFFDKKKPSLADQLNRYVGMAEQDFGMKKGVGEGFGYTPGIEAIRKSGSALGMVEGDPDKVDRIAKEQALFAKQQMQKETEMQRKLLEKSKPKDTKEVEKKTKEIEKNTEAVKQNNDNLDKNVEKLKKEAEELGVGVAELGKKAKALNEVKKASVGAVPPGAVPPGGGGGSDLPGGLVNRSELYGGDSISRYTDNITKAALTQEMLNQRVDLTKVKFGEVRRVVTELSSSMSQHVSLVAKGDTKYDQIAITLEKTSDLLSRYTSESNQATKAKEKLERVKSDFASKFERDTAAYSDTSTLGRMSFKGLGDEEFLKQITKLQNAIDDPGTRKVTGKTTLEGQDKIAKSAVKTSEEMAKLQQQIRNTDEGYTHFRDTIAGMRNISKDATDGIAGLINQLRRLDPEFDKNIRKVKTFEDGLEAFMLSGKRLDMQTKSFGNMKDLEKDLDSMRKRASFSLPEKYKGKDTEAALKAASRDFSLSDAEISTQIRARNKLLDVLSTKHMKVAQAIDAHENMLEQLSKNEKKNKAEIDKTTESLELQNQKFNKIKATQKEYSEQRASLAEIQRRNEGKTAEHFRATVRTTIRGFRDMMKSQMAWVAGYGLMFGAMNFFKTSLMSVITVQHDFARALRTARSETTKTSDLLNEYMQKGVSSMIKFGQSSEMIGEVLYHLGSAGLYAHESLGALNSTLRLIIGTEADVGETTKMIAGIYNNFSQQILSTSGVMGKFEYINNVIVATFRDHQVEIKELRDGLKHLSAMGKESNLTFTEQVGVLATLNDHLIKSGIAGRSVQTMLSKISKSPLAFAKAFDIQINPLMPLNLISILEQVNQKISKGAMSTQEVGNVFDRLGLRGAKTFITLVKYIDEVKQNIDDLKNKSEGANEAVSDIMLNKPDVAFAKMREALGALVRIGFGPVVEGAFQLAKNIAKIGNEVHTINKDMGGLLSFIFKFISSMTLVGTSLWAFKTIGRKAFGKDTFDGHYMRRYFADLSKRSKEATTSIMSDISMAFAGKGRAVGPVGPIIPLAQFKMLERAKIRIKSLNSAVNQLGQSLMGSAIAFKALLAVAAIYAAVKIVDTLVTTNKEYVELSNNISGVISQSLSEIQAIDQKIKSYEGQTGAVQDYINLLKEQKKIEERATVSKFKGQVEKYVKGYQKMMNTAKNLREYENMIKTQMETDPEAAFVGSDVNKKLKETIELLDKQRKNMLQTQAGMEKLKKDNPKLYDQLLAEMEKATKFTESFNEMIEKSGKVVTDYYNKVGLGKRTTEVGNSTQDEAEMLKTIRLSAGAYDELAAKRMAAAKAGEYYTLQEKLTEQQEKLSIEVKNTTDLTESQRRVLNDITDLTDKQLKDIGAANILNIKEVKTLKEVQIIVEKILQYRTKLELLEEKITARAIEQVRALERMQLVTQNFANKTTGSTFGNSALSNIFTLDKETELRLDNQISKATKLINTFKTKDLREKQIWWDKQPMTNKVSSSGLREDELDALYGAYIDKDKTMNEMIIKFEKQYKMDKFPIDYMIDAFSRTKTAAMEVYDAQLKLGKIDELSIMSAKAEAQGSYDVEILEEKLLLQKLNLEYVNKALRDENKRTKKDYDRIKFLKLEKTNLEGIIEQNKKRIKTEQELIKLNVIRVQSKYQSELDIMKANQTFDLSSMSRNSADKIREMNYGMAIAQTKTAELDNITAQYTSTISNLKDEIKKENKIVEAKELLLFGILDGQVKLNLEVKNEIDKLNLSIELKEKLLEAMGEEMAWKIKMADINRTVADTEYRAAAAREAYQSSIGSTGSFDENVDKNIGSLNAYIRLTQEAQSKDFFEIQLVKLKNYGASEKEMSEAILGFSKKMYDDRTLMAKAYYDYIVQRQNELYQAEAEVLMRTAETDKEVLDATLKSIGAGFSNYYTQIENTSKQISSSVSSTMASLTSTIIDFNSALVMGFPEVSGEVDGLRQKLGQLEQQYNDALGQDRLDQVAAIQNEMSKVRGEIDDLQDPLKRAAQYFETFAEGVIKEIQKIIVQQLIMKQLMEALKGWMNTGTSAAQMNDITMSGGGTGFETYAEGGYVMGGIPGKDSVPILGMPGEFMIPKDSVDYYGIELMRKLQNRELDRMAEGGLVGGGMDYSGNNSNFGTNISVKLENQGASQIETKQATVTQIDPKQYVVNVILDDVDSFGPLYQAFKGGR
jgi:hypothetical protein